MGGKYGIRAFLEEDFSCSGLYLQMKVDFARFIEKHKLVAYDFLPTLFKGLQV